MRQAELEKTADPPEIPVRTRRSGVLRILAGGVVLGILLFSVLAHIVSASHGVLWNRLSSLLTGRSNGVEIATPAVVEKIRKLSRLETVIYSVDKIVEGERQTSMLPSFLAGDKLLLVAHGEVIAGIDLSQLQNSDVSVSGDTVTMHLPAPQILSASLDNKRTNVYSRTTGVLVEADPNLETLVRRSAEQQITQAAIADGILDKARENARASVTTLLYGLGFHTVSVS
jgi:Protein of unknown function (DUF4230)